MVRFGLSYFQCHQRQHGKQDAYQYEVLDNGVFVLSFLLEMMVDRRHQEYASSFAIFFLGIFEIGFLNDYAAGFNEVDAAEDRDEQFLADDDAGNGHDAAEHQAACVAHKDLGGEAVPPVETQAGTNGGGDEYYELPDVGDVHDV